MLLLVVLFKQHRRVSKSALRRLRRQNQSGWVGMNLNENEEEFEEDLDFDSNDERDHSDSEGEHLAVQYVIPPNLADVFSAAGAEGEQLFAVGE